MKLHYYFCKKLFGSSRFIHHSSQKSAPILTPSHKRYSIVCSAESHKGRKYAFTLAEVLITLGIIGIVAALTMPSLMANYQKKVLVTQLKKQVNVINNNFRRIMADEGVDKICDTSIAVEDCGRNGTVSIDPNLYKKYFGLDYASEYSPTAQFLKNFGEDVVIFQAKDGSILTISNEIFLIDINGDKNPNLAGRDRFTFVLEDTGFINSTFDDMSYLENFCKMAVNKDYPDELEQHLAAWLFGGNACFIKIVHDGWQMKY